MTRRRQLRVKSWKPGDPEPKPRTEAQIAAHRRTWGIVQLRSLWTLSCYVRTPWRLRAIRWLIDSELKSRGAEPHGVRYRRQQAEFMADLQADRREREARRAEADRHIPF